MLSKFIPKSVPARVFICAALYLAACVGALSWRMHDYIQAGCSWRRIAFYAGAIIVCIVADWFFLCGEKIACAFLLGVSVFGAVFSMALLLTGHSLLFSLVELGFLALGAYTFFSGRYFVGEGIGRASTVDSMFIVLGSGMCMIPVCSFLFNGGLPVEAAFSFVIAVFYCLHTKVGKYCAMAYTLSSLFIYGLSFYYTGNAFHLLIAIAYALVVVITYKQKDNFNVKLRGHK